MKKYFLCIFAEKWRSQNSNTNIPINKIGPCFILNISNKINIKTHITLVYNVDFNNLNINARRNKPDVSKRNYLNHVWSELYSLCIQQKISYYVVANSLQDGILWPSQKIPRYWSTLFLTTEHMFLCRKNEVLLQSIFQFQFLNITYNIFQINDVQLLCVMIYCIYWKTFLW